MIVLPSLQAIGQLAQPRRIGAAGYVELKPAISTARSSARYVVSCGIVQIYEAKPISFVMTMITLDQE
jgi:hypothetical protein